MSDRYEIHGKYADEPRNLTADDQNRMDHYARSGEFGAALFGQWVPRIFEASTSDELRKLTLSARKGDVCYFTADVTNGIDWTLRFSGDGSTYPWRYVGGASLMSPMIGATVAETGASGAYGDLATLGPDLTAPLAGHYDVTHVAQINCDTVNESGLVSYAIGAVAASDAWCITAGQNATGVGGNTSTQRTTRQFDVVAGALMRMKYRNGGASVDYSRRQLSIVPVRVG